MIVTTVIVPHAEVTFFEIDLATQDRSCPVKDR